MTLTYRLASDPVNPDSGRRRAGWAASAALAASALAAACDGRERAAEAAIDAFLAAVQAQDGERLFCLVAGASETAAGDPEGARRRFAEWAAERFADYEEGRDRGVVALDDHGIVLVKLFALGKGTYYEIREIERPAESVLVVETLLRFGYAHADLSRFSPGTTLYFAALPVGRVVAVRIPQRSGEIGQSVLDSIRVRFTLSRAAPGGGCPGGYAVASAEPVAGSERTVELTWIF